ncbi:MAG: ABC transporter ATP-binding protein [Spirochaetaceae bacterium]|jgi:nickel transport system ATP-binding protein|nr:ABC transporter ATP-binding protein [Spirochaetaceae bacterium]
MSGETENALEIQGLTVAAASSGKVLVDNLSFSLRYGGITALVGESGCGKTMTAAAIMGLLPAGTVKRAGSISIGGTDTASLSAEAYRQMRNTAVSVVMQNPMSAFDPVLTIDTHFWETLASHGFKNRRRAREQAAESLSQAGFPDPKTILDLYPFQMSGGMLQRVMLAVALFSRPALVIADEATTDLDVVSQAKILDLLREHCKDRAMLLITHDFSVAKYLAQEIILMKNGALVERQEAGGFFTSPQSGYAKQLLACHQSLYTSRFKKMLAVIKDHERGAHEPA